MCARDEVRQLGDGKHKDEMEQRLNSRDTHLLLGLCCLHLHPVFLLKALLHRVECCLYILCSTRKFWQANGACAGYMGHLFIKSESRASTIALISHSLL